jgi:uncharacterized membrane protein
MLLFTLAANPIQEATDYTLKWGTSLPPWLIALIAFLFVCWVYGCYRQEVATSSRTVKFFLGSLRWIILLVLLAILCEPILQKQFSEISKSYVVFLIDSSLSMNTPDDYQNAEERKEILTLLAMEQDTAEKTRISRMQIVNHLLAKSKRLPALKDECELRFFTFDKELSGLPNLQKLEANGELTNIYDSMVKAIDSLQGKRIAAIFVLSDGQHNTGRNSWQQAAEYAKQREFPIPVYTVGIGTTTKKRDIILAGVEGPEIALVDDKVRFDVEIRHVGYSGETVPVYLKWGETRLAEEMVTLQKEDEMQKVALYHTFRIPDDYQITVVIPEQAGEFTSENNMRQHNIKIIQQKLKVLYVENLPRWEYRYLRNALIRDETVQANTWLLSADKEFPQDRSKNAPSISGLPTTKEEMAAYHCVVLGDVPSEQLGENFMKLLVDFIKEEGGGLAFIPGLHNPAEYWDTPLADLLPVIVEQPDFEGSFDQQQRLRLTPEGKLHPIMRLMSNNDDNVQLWENERDGLPGFYWYFPVSQVKPGATVLAVHSSRRKPLMVTQFYGKGKTFFTALDESWRWRFLYGDRYFYRFWGQVVRHVAMGLLTSGTRKYYLRVDNTQYTLGEVVNVVLRVRDPNTRQSDRPGEWEIFYKIPAGEDESKKLKKNPNDPDSYEGSLLASRIGNYKVWIKTEEGKELNTIFHVVAPTAETENTKLNEDDLKHIAKYTDGKYLKPYELEKFLSQLTPDTQKITSFVREELLWDTPSLFWLLVGLFTLEWILRKLARML